MNIIIGKDIFFMEETCMREREKSRYTGLVLFCLFTLLLFILLLVIGSFYDENIATSLYNPGTFIKYVTSIGAFPFFAFAVLFTGAIYERILHSEMGKPKRITLCTICCIVATFVGFIGAGTLVDKDSLGSIFPELNRNIPVILGISVISVPLLIRLGFNLAKKSEETGLIKRIVCLLILLVLAFVLLQVFKNTFHRPRFRLVMEGHEEIGFIPWYKSFDDYQLMIDKYGIDVGEFRSFPSGHSILSISLVVILQSLSWFSTKLKDKKILLGVAGLLFAVIIMFTRLVLGAHYVSDISAGAIIGSVLAIIYTVIENAIDKSEKRKQS